jgi:hypothetical protein
MSVEKSIEGVTQFWKANQDLVEQVQKTSQDAVDDIKTIADALQKNQHQAVELADGLGGNFQVAATADVKQKQSGLIQQIQALNKEIEEFHGAPAITADLYAQRGTLYVALADTFDDSVEQIVQFSSDEIKALNELLAQAALDTASRQKWATVLNAAVSLTEMTLKLATKLAA